jgi:serine/threonine protein kinase/tetratricopeptide (TPR) repeat protein
MNPARWKLTVDIFQAALDEPADKRLSFVHESCKEEPEIEAQVCKLLAADEKAGSFLERPEIPSGVIQALGSTHESMFAAGSVLSGRFEIVRLLGQGGMGQVYEAVDLDLRQRIALKTIRPEISSDSCTLARFKKEVSLTRRITHPNVCRTFDLDRHSELSADGTRSEVVFLTMELLVGETLSQLLRRKGKLSVEESFPIVSQLVEALTAAHKAGVIHRDLKPSNILLVSTPEKSRVVVTDFGLARGLQPDRNSVGEGPLSAMTGSEQMLGTLVYMAPELLEGGEATEASDIYALGLIAFEMVTGKRPFADENSLFEAVKRLKQPAPGAQQLVPDLSPTWTTVIARCLGRNPSDRFGSTEEVLRSITESGETTAGRKRLAYQISSEGQVSGTAGVNIRRWLKVLGIFSATVALLLVTLRFYQRKEDSQIALGAAVLLTEISNESHDSEMNGIGELFRNQLSQSAYMNLLEPSRIRETLERMSRPIGASLEPRIAREVAWRQGVPIVVFGSLSRVADDYRFDLKMERVGSDPAYPRASWSFSETSQTKRDLMESVHHGGLWIRRLVGENESEIQATDRRPEDVTTSSWEALNLYSEGQRLAAKDRLEEAALQFKRAAEKDPEFAMAWMRRGDTLDNLGRIDEGFGCWQKAISISGDRRLSQREELRIKGMFASDTGDLKSAIDYFGQYAIGYPNDYLGYFFRSYPLMLIGRTEEAVQVLNEAEKLAPNSYYIADHLARYHLITGHFDTVARYTLRLRQLGRDGYADQIDGQADVVKGNYDAAHGAFRRLFRSSDPYLRSASFYLDASAFAERGRYDEAIEALTKGIETDLSLGDTAAAADKWIALAYLNARRLDRRASRSASLEALTLSRDVRRIAVVGALLARNGFIADAQKLLKQAPEDRHFPFALIAAHRLRGEVLLAEGHCGAALREFEKAKTLDQEFGLLKDYWLHALVACGRLPEALEEVDRLRSRVGQVWHHPENYMPGWDADLLYQAASLRYQLKDPDAGKQLAKYLSLRNGATIPEVSEAGRMYMQTVKSTTIN